MGNFNLNLLKLIHILNFLVILRISFANLFRNTLCRHSEKTRPVNSRSHKLISRDTLHVATYV